MGHKSKRFKKSSDAQITITDFKTSFKHFKRRDPPPDFDKIVDVRNAKFNLSFEKVLPHQCDLVIEHANDVTQWSINKLLSNSGITIIQNVFSSSHLKYWASRCIKVSLINIVWMLVGLSKPLKFYINEGKRKTCKIQSSLKTNRSNYCPDFLFYQCNYRWMIFRILVERVTKEILTIQIWILILKIGMLVAQTF